MTKTIELTDEVLNQFSADEKQKLDFIAYQQGQAREEHEAYFTSSLKEVKPDFKKYGSLKQFTDHLESSGIESASQSAQRLYAELMQARPELFNS